MELIVIEKSWRQRIKCMCAASWVTPASHYSFNPSQSSNNLLDSITIGCSTVWCVFHRIGLISFNKFEGWEHLRTWQRGRNKWIFMMPQRSFICSYATLLILRANSAVLWSSSYESASPKLAAYVIHVIQPFHDQERSFGSSVSQGHSVRKMGEQENY
jgi:hypothetical protein